MVDHVNPGLRSGGIVLPSDVRLDSGLTADMIERAARALCELAGYDPEYLEPGNVIIHPMDDVEAWASPEGVHLDTLADNGTRPPDGNDGKDPCHFMWRQFIERAQVALRAALCDRP